MLLLRWSYTLEIFFYVLEYWTIFRFQVVKDKSLILNQLLIHVLLPWWLRQK